VQYVVVQGDTLFQLSLRYGVSQAQLQAANCLVTPEIKYGQTLYVPFVAPTATQAEPSPTATTVPTDTPVPSPLHVNGVTLVSVQADSSRPNGAIATIYINVSGGNAPYTFYNDGAPQAGNPFPVLTECGGALLHTLRVLSGDGQTVDYPYYYSPVNCP
jgi:murein DD-endopeptidase MepM/ murein hydrolase activator NlpD